MKFTEFIKDYVKKHPGVKYKDAVKDKKVRCLWHAHRGKEIGCPSECPLPSAMPEKLQYETLPRPSSYQTPVAQYVPQAGGRRYRDMIPNLGANATRESAAQTEYVDADGNRDESIPQQTGRLNLFSALLPRNVFQQRPNRRVPEYVELNQDILDAETVDPSILDDETVSMPSLEERTVASAITAPSVYPEYPVEEMQEVVSPVRAEIERLNNKFVEDGINWMTQAFRPHMSTLRGTQAHRQKAMNTLINHKVTSIPNEDDRKKFVEGLNTGNERGSLWKVYYDQSDNKWKYDGGPGGGRIKGGMAEGANPKVEYPGYITYQEVLRKANEIKQKYPVKMGMSPATMDEESINDLRSMELHRRYHVEEAEAKKNEEKVLNKIPENEGIDLRRYTKPTVKSGGNKGSGFFDYLGLTGHWDHPAVKGSNYSLSIFGSLRQGGLVEQYRKGAGKKGERDDIFDNERWTYRKPTKEEVRDTAIKNAQRTLATSGINSRKTDKDLWEEARIGKKFYEGLTDEQKVIEDLGGAQSSFARLAAADKSDFYAQKGLQKRLDKMKSSQAREEEKSERAAKRQKNTAAREQEVANREAMVASSSSSLPVRDYWKDSTYKYDQVTGSHYLGDKTQLDVARHRIESLTGQEHTRSWEQIFKEAKERDMDFWKANPEEAPLIGGYESEGSLEF